MTYTVEIQKEYALRILEDLQLLNAIRFHEVKADEDDDLADEDADDDDDEPELTKEQLLAKVANALNDVKLFRQGKIKMRTLDEFLDDL